MDNKELIEAIVTIRDTIVAIDIDLHLSEDSSDTQQLAIDRCDAVINSLSKERRFKDGCDNCKHNMPGVNAGLSRINNCVSGSHFETKTQPTCTCAQGKGLDHDEEGKPYCIDCGNYTEVKP